MAFKKKLLSYIEIQICIQKKTSDEMCDMLIDRCDMLIDRSEGDVGELSDESYSDGRCDMLIDRCDMLIDRCDMLIDRSDMLVDRQV